MISFALRDGGIKEVQEFERQFAEFMGVKYAVAVCNGTMADIIALAVLKEKFPNKKKVIMPALTFVAQLNAVLFNNLEPVFYDVCDIVVPPDDSLCLFPVHLLGKPQEFDSNLPVIEDACEALGSKYRNDELCGTAGDMGVFSFYATHTMTTGEGGMIVTNNEEYANIARSLRNFGEGREKFRYDRIGWNAKMSKQAAELGLEGMKTLKRDLKKRHANYLYMGGKEEEGEYIVPHGLPRFYENRDVKMKELKEKGIDCRPIFSCLPTQEPAYAFLGHKEGDFPEAERIGKTGLYVPCHQNLTKEEMDYIKQCV